MKHFSLSIVGATGLVGQNFLKILEEFDLPISDLYLFASSKSAGKTITFNNKDYQVIELSEKNIKKYPSDYALFSAGGNISLAFAPLFKAQKTIVIDNSSAWRMASNIPLVVPEINMNDIKDDFIIANPNCSTIQSVLPLKALMQIYSIKQIHYATYQAVSGSGQKGVTDFERTKNGEDPQNYPHPIYNNVLPHIDVFLDNGYTKEEEKMILETRKILHLDVPVTATCVRVPVINSHSVSVTVTLDQDVELDKVYDAFNHFDGLKVVDDVKNNIYPIPSMATGQNDTLVGRIRKDYYNNNVLHFFVVADNIRKGAALNAVQILKSLIERNN